MIGWEAVSKVYKTEAGGFRQHKNHINYLDFLAVTLAVKLFVKDRKNDYVGGTALV